MTKKRSLTGIYLLCQYVVEEDADDQVGSESFKSATSMTQSNAVLPHRNGGTTTIDSNAGSQALFFDTKTDAELDEETFTAWEKKSHTIRPPGPAFFAKTRSEMEEEINGDIFAAMGEERPADGGVEDVLNDEFDWLVGSVMNQ